MINESFPFQPHSETSKQAPAEASDASSRRWQVFSFLRASGAATDEQIQDIWDIPASTERPRRVELCQAGVVRDSGRTAMTRSGRAAVLWEVPPTCRMLSMAQVNHRVATRPHGKTKSDPNAELRAVCRQLIDSKYVEGGDSLWQVTAVDPFILDRLEKLL